MIEVKRKREFVTVMFFTVAALLIVACTKDKVPPLPSVPQPTKWEQISGDYKVYDTNGVYLYEMNISYFFVQNPNGGHFDSLYFENFDGQFNIGAHQDLSNQYPPYYVDLGHQDTLYDTLGKRWKILEYPNNSQANLFSNDTIYLSFIKTNINYWIYDLVPYYQCYCKQFAVKQ